MAGADDIADGELLSRWQDAGEQQAFDAIVRRHIDLVYNAARRQLASAGEGAAVDDVTQAVFIVLSRKPQAAMRAKSLPAWLHLTTRYAVANHRKLNLRRRRHENSAAAQRPEATMPDESIGPDPLVAMLDEAIASLPEKDRAAIVLRHLQGQSLETVAAGTGVSADTARKRGERAILKLKRFFTRRGIAGVTVGTVVGALTSANASAAVAPPWLIASLTSAKTVAAASSATLIAKGAITMMAWTKVKVVVAVAAVVIVGGVGVETVRTLVAQDIKPEANPPVASAPPAPTSPAPTTAQAVPFGATFYNGITIQLLGVNENSSAGHDWWWPDGQPLKTPPYQSLGATSHAADGNIAREFALRKFVPPSLAANAPTMRWTITGSSGSAGGSAQDARQVTLPDVIAFSSAIPDRPATLRIKIAADALQTVGTMPKPISKTSFKDSDVIVHPVRDNDTGVEIDIETDYDDFEIVTDIRTISGGSTWFPARRTMSGDRIMTFDFAKPRDDINEIRVRRRRFNQWVEFRDISVHSGTSSLVKIQTNESLVLPDGVTLEYGSDASIGLKFDRPKGWAVEGPKVIDSTSGRTELRIAKPEGPGLQSTMTLRSLHTGGIATIDTASPPNPGTTASRIFEIDGVPARWTAYSLSDPVSHGELLTVQFAGRKGGYYEISLVFPSAERERYLNLAWMICDSVRFLNP